MVVLTNGYMPWPDRPTRARLVVAIIGDQGAVQQAPQWASKTRKGNRWLRGALVEAAHSSTRTKTYLAAQFRRLATRHGPKKAMVAVAHSILRIVYHLLIDDHPFEDLCEAYFDQRQREHVSRRLTQRLERLGYRVQLDPVSSAA